MRFIIVIKATADSEAGVMPPESLMAQMADYHEELQRAGVLVDAAGIQPTSKGWRVRYSGDNRALTEGPFPDAVGQISGYTLIDVKSRQEALDWSMRYPNPAGNGKACEIDVRQLFGLDDFETNPTVERMREMGAGT